MLQVFFNDGIYLSKFQRGDTIVTFTNSFAPQGATNIPELNETNIAWETDLEKKFKNPTETNANNFETYRYLWQTYDQMSCYSEVDLTQRVTCTTWQQVASRDTQFNGTVFGEGCAECPTGSIAVYQGGIPPPTEDTENSNQGIRNEHFVVWMRTAALPRFRKLFAHVNFKSNSQNEGFKKGDIITFRVIPNFEVQSFDGEKSLVLSTASPLGGKNEFLGIAYLVVGVICLILALVFVIKLKVSDRKLGDPKFLTRKQK